MKKIIIGISVVVVILLYFFISPIFDVKEVQDTLPEETATTNLRPSGAETLSETEKKQMLDEMDDANASGPKVTNDPDRTIEPISDVEAVLEIAPTLIQHTVGHPASGSVRIINTTAGPIIRFEDFETINGPELHVYLSKDLEAGEFVDLGEIRGTKGNINYSIPDDVDISEYKYVMHWCVPFGVLFNYAEL